MQHEINGCGEGIKICQLALNLRAEEDKEEDVEEEEKLCFIFNKAKKIKNWDRTN